MECRSVTSSPSVIPTHITTLLNVPNDVLNYLVAKFLEPKDAMALSLVNRRLRDLGFMRMAAPGTKGPAKQQLLEATCRSFNGCIRKVAPGMRIHLIQPSIAAALKWRNGYTRMTARAVMM